MSLAHLNRRDLLKSFVGSALASPGRAQPSRPMNFVFVLIDDLGWHDTGPYGNTVVDTPNLDRFARESVRFTNAYAACPVCSPTRASILTGKYPARLQLTDWIPGRKAWPTARLRTPAFKQALPLKEITLAEALKSKSYTSAAIGKWHLGGDGLGPLQQGFDRNIGGTAAGSPPTYFGPLELPNLQLKPGEFLTKRLADESIRFMDENVARPFFLYHASFSVHIPLQAPPELVAKYKDRATEDIDPTYCAMIESTDQSIGALLKTIDASPLADRTVVVFFSDNGGVRFQEKRRVPITNNAPLRAGKGHLFEGGIREPLLIRWPGLTKAGRSIDTPVCSVDFFPTFARAAGVEHSSVDGVDLRPLLSGQTIPERPLFWHYPHYSDQGGRPSGAVRLGDWKLIEVFEDGHLELFNLASDPGEQRNLARREKGRAIQLLTLLRDWRSSVNAAMPTLNPQFDPARANENLSGYEPATPAV